MNKVANGIERHFTGGTGGYWYIEKDRQKEAEMFRAAVDEINRLQAHVEHLEKQMDFELEDYRKRLKEAVDAYENATAHIWNHAERVRNAAKGLVTQIDKVKDTCPVMPPLLEL